MSQTLRVEIVGDASSYSKALDKASGATHGFGGTLLKLGKTAAIAGGAAGIGGLFAVLKVGIPEYAESAKVAAQTNAVIKSTGKAANVTAKQVDALATSIMNKSGIDDEAIKTSENMLLTFTNIRNAAGKNNDIFSQATKIVADMDTAMSHGNSTAESLSKTSILVGKALNDPIKGMTALSRVGVTFTEGQKKTVKSLVESGHSMQAQQLILKELNKEFGGSAKALGDTLPGKINILKQNFSNLAGEMVAHLVPTFTKFIDFLTKHMPEIEKAVDEAMKGIGRAIQWLVGQVQSHWGTITNVITTAVEAIKSAGHGLTEFFQTDIGKATAIAGSAMIVLAEGLHIAGKALTVFKTAATALGGTPQLIALTALITGIAYLGIKLGIIHNPFSTATTDADRFAAALNNAAGAARNTANALDTLKGANLGVDEAHARNIATLHDAQAAQARYNEFVAKGTQNTLAGKQAHDQATSAWQAHERSALDLTGALDKQSEAQVKASQSVREAVPGMGAFAKQLDNLATLSGPAANKVAGALGGELLKVGQASVESAAKLQTTNPVAAATERSFGSLQKAAGTLLIQLGRVPTRTEIIAEAKAEGGPKFLTDLRTFVKASQQAGTDIPAWLRKAAGPTKAAVNQVATAVAAGAPAAAEAGKKIGRSAGAGIAAGLLEYVTTVANAAARMVGEAFAAAGQKKHGSGEWMFTKKAVGEPLALGVIQGFASVMATRGSEFARPLVASILTGVKGLGPAIKVLGSSLVIRLVAALKGAATESVKAGETVGKSVVKGLGNAAPAIIAAAKKYGVDARAALAVAMTEGGTKFGAVGDNGTSFGPFQLHIGGASPFSDPGKAAAFANSIKGITYALNQMADAGAKGKTGFDAIKAIVTSFERPANPSAEIAKAIAYYKEIPKQLGGALEEGGQKTAAALLKTLNQLAALVKQYGPQIGRDHAVGIIAGLVGKTPDIVAAAKAQMEKVVAAMAAVTQARTDLKTAFQSLAQGAISAFDEIASAWVPPSMKKLTEMQAEDAINSAVDAVAKAQTEIDQAVAARETITRTEGETDADFAARVAEADARIKTAVEAAGAAERSYREFQLGLQAQQEQEAHNKQMAADKTHLEARLLQIQTYLLEHPKAYAKTQNDIIKLMKTYHIPLKKSGQALAEMFGAGLGDGLDTVIKALHKLTAALDDVKSTLGVTGGGKATNPNSYGERQPDLVGSKGRGSAAMNVTVNMPNYLGDKREAAQTIRQELQRIGRDNAVNPLAI